jgi:hypothetical protein
MIPIWEIFLIAIGYLSVGYWYDVNIKHDTLYFSREVAVIVGFVFVLTFRHFCSWASEKIKELVNRRKHQDSNFAHAEGNTVMSSVGGRSVPPEEQVRAFETHMIGRAREVTATTATGERQIFRGAPVTSAIPGEFPTINDASRDGGVSEYVEEPIKESTKESAPSPAQEPIEESNRLQRTLE